MYKVLIIDDEESIREGLQNIINWDSLGCSIVGEAEDGDTGVELIESLKPDIVLTDIRMSGLDGLEMISKIKELKINCKIIILTGYRSFDYAQEAVRLGTFRFILKPSKKDEIISAVKDAIEEINASTLKEKTFINFQKKVMQFYGINDENQSEPVNIQAGPDNSNPKFIVGKAISYMKENYSAELSMGNVADKLYISTWHLSKLLKKETGKTFVEILNEIRINEAKRLLAEPKYKIYNIAEMIGFSNIPYFIRLFKKLVGVTPLEYKNRAGV